LSKANTTDVCIVGGGIVGLSSAYFLANQGSSVTLVEKDSIGSHASGFAYGSLSPLGEAGLEKEILPEIQLAHLGMKIHSEFASDLLRLTGIDIQYRTRPSIDLAFSDEECYSGMKQAQWKTLEEGYTVNWISGNMARELVPSLSPKVSGAVYTEGVADVDPYRLTLALAQACEHLGVLIRHGEVIGLKTSGTVLEGVRTTSGIINCKQVVLAAGPWIGLCSEWLGIKIPISPLKGQILRLDSPDTPINCSVGWRGNYACTKLDGLIWAGTTEESVGFDDTVTNSGRDQIIGNILEMLPELDKARVVQQTACLRPVSADNKIILGDIPNVTGAYIATGTGRKGILLGPAMGKLISTLVIDKKCPIDIKDFSLRRFPLR